MTAGAITYVHGRIKKLGVLKKKWRTKFENLKKEKLIGPTFQMRIMVFVRIL
jgi:hypothetical protein